MTIAETQKVFLLLQVNDALFPIGGYSHSFGLETYIQKGLVRDDASAYDYISKRLMYSIAYTELLSVRLAYQAAGQHDLNRLKRLEDIIKASTIPMELRAAAWKLGNRFIKTLLHAGAVVPTGMLYQHWEQQGRKTVSHSCAYGIFCQDMCIPLPQAMTHFLYAQASAMLTNCVKSIPLSQSSGQKLLIELYPVLADTLAIAEQAEEEMLCMSVPGFDLRSLQHETLYSRLFMS